MKPLTEPLGSTIETPPAKGSPAPLRFAIGVHIRGENVPYADAQEFVFADPGPAKEFGRAVIAAALKLHRKVDADREEDGR